MGTEEGLNLGLSPYLRNPLISPSSISESRLVARRFLANNPLCPTAGLVLQITSLYIIRRRNFSVRRVSFWFP